MEAGTAVLSFRTSVTLDFSAFAEASRASSHRLRKVVVETIGRFDGSEDRIEFVMSGTGQRLTADLQSHPRPPDEARIRAVVIDPAAPVLRIEELRSPP